MQEDNSFKLFESIRSACTSHVWSQGAKLARQGAVSEISENSEEIVLRVHAPGFAVDPEVVLYPEDDDWECDCKLKDDNCSHVAAAAIALKQARVKGKDLQESSVPKVGLEYRFGRLKGGISLHRYFMGVEGKESLLDKPLMSTVNTRSFAFGFRPSQTDLVVDQIIGRALRLKRPFSVEQAAKIFKALTGAPNVFFDGRPVTISDEALLPRIVVKDYEGGGVQLEVLPNPHVTEVVAAGFALCGNTLGEIGERQLCGPTLEKLPATIVFKKKELAELTAQKLPDLQQRVDVEISTDRLPEISRFVRPRLVMEMDQEGSTLCVLPKLVYGNPPNVVIEQDRMVYLEGTIPVRDRQAERKLTAKLRDDLNLVTGRRVNYSGKDGSHFLNLVHEWGAEILDSSQQLLNDVAPLVPVIEVNDDVINVTFVLEDDTAAEAKVTTTKTRRADSMSVLSAWKEGLGIAPLDGGGWAPIPKDWLGKYGHLVSDILAARLEGDRVAPAGIPMLAKLCRDLELPGQPCFDKLAPLIEGFESIPSASLPEDLTATLRPYQRQGIDWLCFIREIGLGAILADDMGLGKTLEVLCAVKGRTLVVCPTSVLHNWANEIDKFRPGLNYNVFHGPKRKLDENASVVLTTYALLRIEAGLLTKQKWDSVVLDEAQNIKNSDSQAARAAFKLAGKFCIAVSGTPVENRLEELWSLFNFCNRGLLGGRSSFQKRFSDPISLGEKEAAVSLRERIRPFVLRRLKQNVAPDLPPRTSQVIECELHEHERQVYNAVKATTSKTVVSKLSKGGSVMAALEALLRLRQSSCHVGLVPGHEAESSSKIELLLDRLSYTIANSHKALVFSQWTSLLDKVEPHLESAGIAYTRLDGTTKNRGAVVEEFQNEQGPPVMLISLKAGGTGLNLVEADHVFLLDPWWNPAVEDQAADRAHRIGQEKPVMIYRLVATDTVEERIIDLQKRKRNLADAALGNADQALSLTRDDLLALLE